MTEIQNRQAGSIIALARALGVAHLTEAELLVSPLDFGAIPFADAVRRRVVPLKRQGQAPLFVIADPNDTHLLEWLAIRMQAPIEWALAQSRDVDSCLSTAGTEGEGDSKVGAFPSSQPADADISASAVVAFVARVTQDAWRAGASDIHFETRRCSLQVRYRVDGVLVDVERWTGQEPASEVVSRIKVLAELDIAERRIPQDGRFSMQLGSRVVDFRVSVMPNAFGEDVVIRLLDKQHLVSASGQMTLDGLGFLGQALERIRKLATQPHGMLLVTGPTGSGKTTTLYAAISETLCGREKVISIEDPIEYELPGVLQIPVNEKKGLTFARGLRSILRHDPDTLFIGEIRDSETADIAIQSALTGHLVFTTVHANDVVDVIGRFIHMDVDLFSFAAALNGVVAQRLLRTLCTTCREPDRDAVSPAHIADSPSRLGGYPMRAVGCAECRQTGYIGRTVISDVIVIDDVFRELVVSRAPVSRIREHVEALSSRSLHRAASELVDSGRTDVMEVRRVLAGF